jgi:glycosyltransferase involved in cell wall biosynthesis
MNFEVTIPVLNEESRLKQGIENTVNFLNYHNKDNWMVVIADNGSTDNTQIISHALVEKYQNVSYLKIQQRGVGLALRTSWSQSSADVVGYMDVDLATDLGHLLEVEDKFHTGDVIINGSRLLHGSKVNGRTILREVTSRSLNWLLKFILSVKFTDAMCGFKFIQKDLANKILQDIPSIPDWFVAAELLIRAEWSGIDVVELPVQWSDDPNSKAKVGKLTIQYLRHIHRLSREKRRSQ